MAPCGSQLHTTLLVRIWAGWQEGAAQRRGSGSFKLKAKVGLPFRRDMEKPLAHTGGEEVGAEALGSGWIKGATHVILRELRGTQSLGGTQNKECQSQTP